MFNEIVRHCDKSNGDKFSEKVMKAAIMWKNNGNGHNKCCWCT